VWLPDRPHPVLNDRKGYATAAERDTAIADLFDEFGLRAPEEVPAVNEGFPVIAAEDEVEAVALGGTFDYLGAS
jgi:hypothetical protein